MTTLPQTSPALLNRPVSANPLLAPGGSGPIIAAPHAAAPSTGMTGSDAWRVIRANAWLISLFVMLFGAVGFVVNNYWLAPYHSRWTARGLVMVRTSAEIPTYGQDHPIDANVEALRTQADTESQILLSGPAIATVLRDPNSPIRSTNWFRQFNGDGTKAQQALLEGLVVIPAGNSRLLSVEMTCPNPEDARTIVESVVDEFIKERTLKQTESANENVSMFTNQKQLTQAKLDNVTSSMKAKIVALGPTGVAVFQSITPQRDELFNLENQQIQANGDYEKAKSSLKKLQDDYDSGQFNPQIEDMVAHDPGYLQYKQEIDNIDITLSLIGPESPMAISYKTRQRALQDKQTQQAMELRVRLQNHMLADAQDAVTGGKALLDDLKTKIDTKSAQLKDLAAAMEDYADFQTQSKDLTQKLDNINNQLTAISLTLGGGEYSTVTWSSHPQKPDAPSFPRLPMTLAVAMTIGLALSLGIAFLRELTDTTVRSPRDIARVGQLALLGMIVHEDDDPQAAAARLPLAIYEAPHSIIAEQFRQVRTRLQHSASLDTTRTILVTSPSPSDGKSMVACNLAAGLALNGRRILLVDTNFRRPSLHSIFNIENEFGFSNVLESVDYFDQAVQQSEVPNLSIMPSGQRPSNPTELLESQLLIDFIERALEEYDHVIFDSGPLLLVSDAIALAPRVDGVVTVVRARGNSRGLLERMRDELRRLKAEHLGVVLNAVRAQGGGYYRGSIKSYYNY